MTDSLCREQSLSRNEPLLGTASVVRRWILIECDGPWGANALRKNRFDEETRSRIQRLGGLIGARMLLIRKHQNQQQTGVRVMCSYTSHTQKWLEEFHVNSIDELFDLDLSPLKNGDSVGGKPVEHNRFFVCTHGKHDPCCAKFGRPVAAALQEKWPERTWETSHIGGDRFAGNMLILPLGVYYGRVEPSHAVSLMTRLDRGELSLEHYRGQSNMPFAAQAAEWWARTKRQWLQLGALSLLRHTKLEGGESLTTFVTQTGENVEVRLLATNEPARRLTCKAARASSSPRYELLSLTAPT